MRKSLALFLSLFMAISLTLTGCSMDKSPLDPKNPTSISLWHNYGGEMQTAMTMLIDTFNATVGKEKGIIVRVDAVSSSSELTKNLDMILDEAPGAPALPNITIAYPKTAVKFAEKGLIADLTSYFSKDKTDLYVDEFIAEGKIGNGLYVFPVAKSTEVLFVNQTLFDRFSGETGVKIESLSTFEGICDASIKYAQWCGKAFFTADSWFNLFSVAGQQMKDSFIKDGELQLESDTYNRLYTLLCDAIEKGGIRIYDGYSSDLTKTGEVVCSLGSTAGILYYGDSITYPDNSTEKVEYSILPYPTAEGGEKIAIQRGNGMMVKKAGKAEEYACAVFLEWLTQPEQNMQFISNTGYLPVTKEAFNSIVNGTIPKVENPNIAKLLTAAVAMLKDYKFYIPPVYDQFDAQSKAFESEFKEKAGALSPVG